MSCQGTIIVGSLAVMLVSAGCDYQVNMAKQPRTRTLQACPVFPDGASARPLVEGVVNTEGEMFSFSVTSPPPPQPPLTMALLQRGQQVFNVSCKPCHGAAGYGDGMVVQRGYPRPPSYHTARLRDKPDDYIFQVITDGLGKMPPYLDQVPSAPDRWAVVAYVRALQLSQHAPVGIVSPSIHFDARREEDVAPIAPQASTEGAH